MQNTGFQWRKYFSASGMGNVPNPRPATFQYLQSIPAKTIAAHENALTERLMRGLASIPGVRVMGGESPRLPIVSFSTEFMQAVDLGQWLGMRGVAVRCGSHCARLALDSCGVTSVV
ncbi:MAG: aminotransferase class V-fold PLP-dependent enzyme, partial [Bacteroidia bacterium]|nr:aminotransferase class V-fold PLP-dependent enzyme [Bacteroidia bacterium]